MNRYLRATRIGEVTPPALAGFDGVVFGAEFCASLLPSTAEVARARESCGEVGVDFVLATPVVAEGGFDRAAAWLEKALSEGGEWVANDLGLLKYGFERGLNSKVTAGRMLCRQQRGREVAGLIAAAEEANRAALAGSLWDDPVTVELFGGYGVTGFELDAVEWGVSRPEPLDGLTLSICAPWCVVTWSPWCFFASVEGEGCRRRCVGEETLKLSDPAQGELFTRGNALFTRTEEGLAWRVAAGAGADRLVWSPLIPG